MVRLAGGGVGGLYAAGLRHRHRRRPQGGEVVLQGGPGGPLAQGGSHGRRPGGRHPGRGAGLDPGSYPRPDPALRLYGISHGAGAGLVYPDRAGEYRGKCRAAGSPFACMAVQGYCSAGVRRGQYRR